MAQQFENVDFVKNDAYNAWLDFKPEESCSSSGGSHDPQCCRTTVSFLDLTSGHQAWDKEYLERFSN